MKVSLEPLVKNIEKKYKNLNRVLGYFERFVDRRKREAFNAG